MSNQITTSFVRQFGDSVLMLAQQQESKLRNSVRVEQIVGEDRAFDQIGSVSMTELTDRHGDTSYVQTPHRRRWVTPTPRTVADLIDRPDMVRTLNDTQNAYVRSFAAAIGREQDMTIINAVEATAKSGKAGTSNVSFDSNMVVPADLETTSTDAPLTVDKLRRAKRLLDERDAGDMRTIVVSPAQMENLLGITEATSSDFNTVKALVNGEINEFLGFKFITTSLMPDNKVYFWDEAGMLLGVAQDPMFKIDEVPTKNYSTSVYASVDIGAVRMEESRVGRMDVDSNAA